MIRVTIVRTSDGHRVAFLALQHVLDLGFSPAGSFILTWQRVTKDANGNTVPNLKVWRLGSKTTAEDLGECLLVGEFIQKSPTSWNLKFSKDERYCTRMVSNEVHVYIRSNFDSVEHRLRLEGLSSFELSPTEETCLSAFIPERKVILALVSYCLIC